MAEGCFGTDRAHVQPHTTAFRAAQKDYGNNWTGLEERDR
jgi:hypothetical protein